MNRVSLRNIAFLALFFLTLLLDINAQAAPVSQCREVQTPVTTSSSSTSLARLFRDPRAPTGALSYDGRFMSFLRQVDPAAPDDPVIRSPVRELFIYDLLTGEEKQITSNSEQSYGEGFFLEDGSYVARSKGRTFFTFDPDTGMQVQVTVGVDLPSLRVADLDGTPQVSPAPEIDEIPETPPAAEARLAGLNHNSSLRVISPNQDVYLLTESGPFLPAGTQLTWFRKSDGQYRNIGEIIAQASGITLDVDNNDFLGDFHLSSDGLRVALPISVQLTGPSAGLPFFLVPNNNYGLASTSFLLDLENETLEPIGEPDISQPREPRRSGSSFIRALGRSGMLAALDRTVPYLNTIGNPDQNGEIYLFRSGEGLTQITNTALGPYNDVFDPGLAFISYDETAILFNSSLDLTGDNPTFDGQLFRYDIETGQLYQITRFSSGLFELASQLGLDLSSFNLNFRGSQQITPFGVSADAKTVVLNTTDVGFRAVRTANGVQVVQSTPVIVCE